MEKEARETRDVTKAKGIKTQFTVRQSKAEFRVVNVFEP